MNKLNESMLVLSLMAAVPMAGCDSSTDEDAPAAAAALELVSPDEVAENPGVELEAEDVPLLARIDGEQDGLVDFLDLSELGGNDEILVVAVGDEGGGVTRLLDEGASPLEVYLALAPDTAAPARLLENHASLAAEGLVPATPRELQTWRETNVGSDCGGGGGVGAPANWWTSWYTGYGATEGHQQFSTSSTFNAGTAITVNNTTKRALEACAWDYRSEFDRATLQTLSGGVWWTLASYTRTTNYVPWGVATRSVSPSGTLSMRLIADNQWGSGYLHWFFWGGAYS